MPAKVILIDATTGKALHTEPYSHEGKPGKVLLVTTIAETYGTFKSQKFTSLGTTKIAEPEGDGSVGLTDLIISFEKKAAAEVTIQFNDGTNTELIWFADLQDAPISLAIGFRGDWQGWQSAWVEVTIAGAALDGSVGIGFVKHLKSESLGYNDWNARR